MLCLSQTCPPTGPQEALESRVQDRDPSPIPACYQLGDSAHHHATAPWASVSPSVKGGMPWDADRVKAVNVATPTHQPHPKGQQMEPSPQYRAQVLSTINST